MGKMKEHAASSRAERIRVINDRCRKHFVGCQVIITEAVQALNGSQRALLLNDVREFNAFDDGNDPHHEHDFGAIDLFGEKWFWKFDYYDPGMRFGSDDPSDTKKTCRVLTIMHASEW